MRADNWTIKNIIKGKTILFVIITLILAKVFYEIANKGLNIYLNQFNKHALYTHDYSFGKFGLLLILPAAILTILIFKLYAKIRNMTYENENNLSPARLKKLRYNPASILTSKITKHILIAVGCIILILFIVEFIKVIIVLFPSIQKTLLKRTIMPIIGLIFVIYIGSIAFMASKAFSKKPMRTSSKYSARFGLLALIFLLSGAFGVLFSVLGIICSIFGITQDSGDGRKIAIHGLLSSLTVLLLVLSGLAIIGYQYV